MVINRNVTFFSFRLPPYIILYIQRFTKNTFYVEKNPTIVNFPIKSIEFGDFLTEEAKEKYPNGAPYDLIANVVHEGLPKTGTYKLHILHKGKYEWI
jgi:U4/U6.U5 tri-snRNP-associated protein 2